MAAWIRPCGEVYGGVVAYGNFGTLNNAVNWL